MLESERSTGDDTCCVAHVEGCAVRIVLGVVGAVVGVENVAACFEALSCSEAITGGEPDAPGAADVEASGISRASNMSCITARFSDMFLLFSSCWLSVDVILLVEVSRLGTRLEKEGAARFELRRIWGSATPAARRFTKRSARVTASNFPNF